MLISISGGMVERFQVLCKESGYTESEMFIELVRDYEGEKVTEPDGISDVVDLMTSYLNKLQQVLDGHLRVLDTATSALIKSIRS